MTVTLSVYLDTNIIIDLIEGADANMQAARAIFHSLIARRDRIVTSELTLAEVLSKAIPDAAAKSYENLLTEQDFLHLLPISRDVLRSAARLRSANNGKPALPDAIHLATAIEVGASALISRNIRDFERYTPPGMAALTDATSLAHWLESRPA